MLAINVNNEFLDLPADLSLELERNNPFLNDDIQGEFSLGLTIKYSEKNYRILNYIGNFYKRNNKYNVDAQLYDNGSLRYIGKLVINQHQANMNNIESTVWTGFFTIGASSFLQEISDTLLEDIDMGGTRSFTWDGYNTSGTGFWAHIHAARTPDLLPYVFYPIQNIGWMEDYEVTFMNKLTDSGSNVFESNIAGHGFMGSGSPISLCPSIYLSYLLTQLFAKFGWKMDGEILSDVGFKKLTIPSFQSIKWVNFYRNMYAKWVFTPLATITFDLADHLPKDTTIGSLLINLKNRFGWYFDFDSNTKTAYLKGCKNLNATAKDWTKYVLSNYLAEYQDAQKIYELDNNIDSADDLPITNNVEVDDDKRVANFAALPAPTSFNEGDIYYAFFENNYYISKIKDGASTYEWGLNANNVGNYVPTGADTVIESDISTMPVALVTHKAGRQIFVPTCKVPGNYAAMKDGPKSWGIRLLFYHGMQTDTAGVPYPYASCHNLTIAGTATGDWSIPYRHEFGSTNDGSYDYWWKYWLEMLSVQDFRTFTLQLPIPDLKKFNFNDTIFINNVFFVVVSIKEVLPYKGTVEMKMKRIY